MLTKDTLIAVVKTKEDGTAKFAEDLPLGKYYIKEIEAPEGYLLSEETVLIDGSYGSKLGGQTVEIQKHQIEIFNDKEDDEKPKEPAKPEPTPKPTPKPESKPEPEVYHPEKIVFENITSPNPVNTGDHSTVYLWGSVAAITVVAVVLLKIKKKS